MDKMLVMYLPVIHAGYLKLFKDVNDPRSPVYGCQTLYVLSDRLIAELTGRPREIRALPATEAASLMQLAGYFTVVKVLDTSVALGNNELVLPDEVVSHSFVDRFANGCNVTYIHTFLRWDEANVLSNNDVCANRESSDPFDREMITEARGAANLSSDWWRQVGAVAVRDGLVLLRSFNHHLPTPYTPYIDGDPRDVIRAGTQSHISTALHCEQDLLTQAARLGVSVLGSDLYVTIFPCPMCAKQVAHAGFRRLFFAGGHASLDGERVLHDQGVELIYVH